MTDTLNATSAVALLLATYPRGFTVDAAGVLTVRDAAVRVTSAQQLRELSRKPHVLKVPLHGDVVEIEVHVLSDRQISEINRLIPSPTPPPKTKLEHGRQVPDGYDREHPKFREELERVYVLRRAVGIAAAIPSLEIPGVSAEEKAAYLEEHYATNLLEVLYEGVRALSVDSVSARASFLSERA